jgi:hypothetical protein
VYKALPLAATTRDAALCGAALTHEVSRAPAEAGWHLDCSDSTGEAKLAVRAEAICF